METKKIGRPTAEPRENRLGIRLSARELDLLQSCVDKTGMTKTETIIRGLELLAREVRRGECDEAAEQRRAAHTGAV